MRRKSKQKRAEERGRDLGIRILGIDPAFRNTGWAKIELSEHGEVVRGAGVIVTEKSDKKQKILMSDDNHRRSREIATALDQVIAEFCPHVVCAESLVGSLNARSATQQGMGWGIVSALVTIHGLPLVQISPMGLKKQMVGQKSATKEAIEEEVVRRYPEARAIVESSVSPASVREHAYDAIAVIASCLDSSEIQTLRRMALIGGANGKQTKTRVNA